MCVCVCVCVCVRKGTNVNVTFLMHVRIACLAAKGSGKLFKPTLYM